MERAAYELMAGHEQVHWWFVGRRAVFDAILARIPLPPDARILEAGCGSGGNLRLLQSRGQVSAFEPFDPALDIARSRHPGIDIRPGELPDALPFEARTFDLVAALDVLEHVDADEAALAALVGLAKPGGRVIVTVPAHQVLWGSHDRRLHHKRRYGRSQLRNLVAGLDVQIEYLTAFNTLLAPIAVAVRLGERLLGVGPANQEQLPPPPLNRILGGVFAFEGSLVARTSIPFGLSYAMLLRVNEA